MQPSTNNRRSFRNRLSARKNPKVVMKMQGPAPNPLTYRHTPQQDYRHGSNKPPYDSSLTFRLIRTPELSREIHSAELVIQTSQDLSSFLLTKVPESFPENSIIQLQVLHPTFFRFRRIVESFERTPSRRCRRNRRGYSVIPRQPTCLTCAGIVGGAHLSWSERLYWKVFGYLNHTLILPIPTTLHSHDSAIGRFIPGDFFQVSDIP